MSEHDPGADLHIWESRFAALAKDLFASPAGATGGSGRPPQGAS